MSGFLPANTSLQLGDNSGNINHQGVLTSNVNGTPLLPTTFPSTSTGNSTCHSHYTDASTNALKFLNASASGVGGHEFWVSTSTSAPIKTFSVNSNGLTLDTKIKNSSNNTELDLAFNELRIKNDLSRVLLLHEALKFIYNDVVNVQLNNSPENPNIYFSSATNNSQLTATDLKFGGVSLKDQVETNKDDINLLEIKQTNLIYQFASPAIYADGRPMIATPTSIINTYAINAWYFINSFASGVNKINWYITPDNGMLVSDILGLYLRFFNVSTTSNDNTMFLTVYTKLQASGNYASWYHSNITYTLDSSITPVVNTNYTMFMNVSTTCPNPSYYGSTLIPMEISSVVPNPKGTYDPTDEILAFSIGTNSTSPINSVEFVLQKFGIMTSTKGTQEFQFAPLIA
jgi:hypothetical protein